MKDILSVLGNVKSSPKSTALGAIFIAIFLQQYFTGEKIELVSIDSALLAVGLGLLFAPDGKKVKDEE